MVLKVKTDLVLNLKNKSFKLLTKSSFVIFDSKEFLQVHSETQVCLKIPFILTFV